MDKYLFDWDDLKYFLALTRSKSLRGGANSINANHTTISRRLSILEEKLDARLFDRTQNGLLLTQMGEELLPYAEKVEEEIFAASRRILGQDSLPSGTVRLSMPHALSLTSIMEDIVSFSHKFPKIDLDIKFTNDISDLNKREADVSLRVSQEVHDDVAGRKLTDLNAAVYCSSDYAEQINDNGGEGLHFIGWKEPEGDLVADWISQSYYPKATLRHRVSELVPQINLAAAGLGLTKIACCLGDRHPQLVRAPYQKVTPHNRSLWLLLHKDMRKTARIRLFVDYLAERISTRRHEFAPLH
ncbi:LysR family transcriptional regulator [Curvivirga sp.]|uniref:LysR family transcriptional regulator n=1 Tax=Curvivirga sp. TaxID=2856848 RepID=UPI003B59438C